MTLRPTIPGVLALAATPVFCAVEITGVDDALDENVAQYIVDEPDCDAGAAAVRRYAAELPDRVRPALEGFGYYAPRITAEPEPGDDACWRIALEIEPGTPVEVDDVALDVTGDARDDPVIAAELERFPLAPGSVLAHDRYAVFKGRLESLARERGYLDARYSEERIDVYVDRNAAEIRLTLDSGPRYEFGPVSFMTDALAEPVLQEFVTFAQGDPYDSAVLAQLQRELSASGYFASANVLPDFDATENLQVPIRVDVQPAEPVSYSVGGGYSTDDGPRFRFTYENDRRNRAGHQLGVDVLLARVRQNATFDYRIPITHPQRDWMSVRAGIAREDIDAGVGSAVRAGVHRTRVRDSLTVTRYMDLLVESDEIAGDAFTTRLAIPGVSWARSRRDDLVRPREGHRFSADLALGVGDLTLLKLDFRGKWIGATPWEGRVIVRGRLGATFEDDVFDRVPLSMRYFAGGDNSVRGYDYESLGPRNEAGELIGGNRVAEASVEYEHPVLESWGVAAFVDSGNAFFDSDFETRTGAGIGARWFSPIGPIRLDVAWPLDSDDRSPQLHISLGPDL